MILIILGMVIFGWVIIKLIPYYKVKSWHKTEGIITKVETVTFNEPQVNVNVTFTRPSIEYSYKFNSQDFKGNKISLEDHSLKVDSTKNNPFWSKWIKNQACPVYVNPDNPHLAILHRSILPNRKNHYLALFLVGILLIAIGSWVQYAQP